MSARRRERRRGELLLTAAVTIAITAMVGVGVGLTVVSRSGGCSEVYANPDTADPADIERCRTALPDQLQVAAAGANFIPTGANDTVASQLIAAGVDQGSRPPATGDAPLPPDVEAVVEGGEPDAGTPDAGSSDPDPDDSCAVIGGAPIPGGLLIGLSLWFVKRARRRRS